MLYDVLFTYLVSRKRWKRHGGPVNQGIVSSSCIIEQNGEISQYEEKWIALDGGDGDRDGVVGVSRHALKTDELTILLLSAMQLRLAASRVRVYYLNSITTTKWDSRSNNNYNNENYYPQLYDFVGYRRQQATEQRTRTASFVDSLSTLVVVAVVNHIV